jgi:hypothetical protein
VIKGVIIATVDENKAKKAKSSGVYILVTIGVNKRATSFARAVPDDKTATFLKILADCPLPKSRLPNLSNSSLMYILNWDTIVRILNPTTNSYKEITK